MLKNKREELSIVTGKEAYVSELSPEMIQSELNGDVSPVAAPQKPLSLISG
jgi:hypothetical protein